MYNAWPEQCEVLNLARAKRSELTQTKTERIAPLGTSKVKCSPKARTKQVLPLGTSYVKCPSMTRSERKVLQPKGTSKASDPLGLDNSKAKCYLNTQTKRVLSLAQAKHVFSLGTS